jgi:hypothetical protein
VITISRRGILEQLAGWTVEDFMGPEMAKTSK